MSERGFIPAIKWVWFVEANKLCTYRSENFVHKCKSTTRCFLYHLLVGRLDFSLREHEGWHDRFPKPLKRHENVPTPQICNKFLSTSNCLFPSLALWLIKMTTIWTSWSQTFFVTFSNIHKPWFNLIKMAAVWPSWHLDLKPSSLHLVTYINLDLI
jgi:hypothetical protein